MTVRPPRHASRPKDRSHGAPEPNRRPRVDRARPAGFASRLAAARIVDAVVVGRATLDEAMEALLPDAGLEPRDRGFARLLAVTVLRRKGSLEAVLASHLRTRPDAGLVWPILLTGSAQLLLLDTPPHAAIDLAVELTGADNRSRHLKGLVNAVLRKVAREGGAAIAALDAVAQDVPDWLFERWEAAYGEPVARAIAVASLVEPGLDISVKSNGEEWARRLGGSVLPTGSVRVAAKGAIEDLDGFDDGEWWVQDAAAAIPPRLLGPVDGRRVADLCAAPGGKTAWLAAAGARVTAVDASVRRLGRVRSNLARLGLDAEIVAADVLNWRPTELFDAVLLDAPCSATGTIRRNPDILRLRSAADVARLAGIQSALLDAAASLVGPGGVLVYCTCSLEPEEGVAQIEAFLARQGGFARDDSGGSVTFTRSRIEAAEVGGLAEFVSPAGDLRTLPHHLPHTDPRLSGIDGFYAARLVRAV